MLQRNLFAQLADYMESSPENIHFNMAWFVEPVEHIDPEIATEHYLPECGTVACIAGFGKELFKTGDSMYAVAKELGISRDQRNWLFHPECAQSPYDWDIDSFPGDPGYISKEHAIRALRYIANGGELGEDIYERCA